MVTFTKMHTHVHMRARPRKSRFHGVYQKHWGAKVPFGMLELQGKYPKGSIIPQHHVYVPKRFGSLAAMVELKLHLQHPHPHLKFGFGSGGETRRPIPRHCCRVWCLFAISSLQRGGASSSPEATWEEEAVLEAISQTPERTLSISAWKIPFCPAIIPCFKND